MLVRAGFIKGEDLNIGLFSGRSILFLRFEYKFSFKPPYLAQKDGSVPFWSYDGNAIASAENVRVTPSLRSQKGRIWSKEMTNFDFWEVELTFRVTGAVFEYLCLSVKIHLFNDIRSRKDRR